MKKMKRLMSLLIVLSMIIGVFTVVEVSAGTIVLKDNFDYYGDAASAQTGGWIKYIDPNTPPDGIAQVDAAHGNSMKIVGKQFYNQYMAATETTGKYKLETSMYIENRESTDDGRIIVGIDGVDEYVVDFNPIDNRFDSGDISVDGVDTNADFYPNTWYDIVVIFDLDAGTYTTTVSDANGTVVTADGTCAKNAAIQSVRYASWRGNNTYIDNVELEPVSETDSWVEDFEWSDALAFRAHGWRAGNALGDSTLALEEATTGDSHGKSMKMPQTTSQYAYPLGKTSGTWKLSASLYPQNTSQQVFVKFGSVPYGDPANAWTGTSEANNLVCFWTKGEIYLDANNGAGGARYFSGNYEANKWYDVSAVIDLDERLYKVTVKNGGTVIAEKINILDSATDLQWVTFTNWAGANSACYIDDISLEPTTEKVSKVIVNDDFEKYTSVVVDGANATTNLYNNGWSPGIWDWGISNATNAPSIDSTTFAGNKVLAMGNDATQGANFELSNPITEGKVKVKFSMNSPAGERLGFFLKNQYNNTDAEYDIVLHGSTSAPNSLMRGNVGDNKTFFFDMTANEWYDIEITIDMDNRVANTRVLKDGKSVGLAKDIPFTKTTQLSSFGFMGWKTGVNDNKPYYIDNFSVELLDSGETQYDYLIEENNFEGYAAYTELGTAAYTFDPRASASYALAGGADGKQALQISGNASRFAKTIAGATAGKVRISYDIKTDGIAVVTFVGTNAANAGMNQALLAYVHADGIGHTYAGIYEDNKLCDYTKGSWVRIENIIDLDKRTISYAVYDEKGIALGEPYVQNGFEWITRSEPGQTIEKLNAFWVRNWGIEGTSVWVDNIKYEYYYGIPSISVASVSARDLAGESVDMTAALITPGLSEIALDFSAELTEESTANGAIKLYEKDGSAEYTGSVEGEKYVIPLSTPLKGNTTYVIYVDESVATSLGSALGQSFTYKFTTSEAECEVISRGVYKYGTATELESIDGLAAGDKIVVWADVVNNTYTAQDVTFLVAYYGSNNILKAVDIAPESADAAFSETIEREFTLQDMTNIEEIRIYVWDNAVNAIPYCEAINL